MSLSDLTADAVRQAIAEFDRVGREVFLKTYGFGKARDYFLVRDRTGPHAELLFSICGLPHQAKRERMAE